MNRETIIQMAREAGLAEVTDTAESLPADYVEALAKLCALAVAKERERLANYFDSTPHTEFFGHSIADFIRTGVG